MVRCRLCSAKTILVILTDFSMVKMLESPISLENLFVKSLASLAKNNLIYDLSTSSLNYTYINAFLNKNRYK